MLLKLEWRLIDTWKFWPSVAGFAFAIAAHPYEVVPAVDIERVIPMTCHHAPAGIVGQYYEPQVYCGRYALVWWERK